ncbi:hypothetical protein BDM02DRAFT_3112186 [Thelephora ganbajun]|uniref:Uncharacterized protein n=1 Tax=Thelephora ganbajun TaxID=370292 RepID=A0ACB6ZLF8_THEGA|nr:hypothetical protein BDM02DRAFT_3112186 [Thelephora ganbajun]
MAGSRVYPNRSRLRQLYLLPGRRSLPARSHIYYGRRPTNPVRFPEAGFDATPKFNVRNPGRDSAAEVCPIYGERVLSGVVLRLTFRSGALDRPYHTPSSTAPPHDTPLGTTTEPITLTDSQSEPFHSPATGEAFTYVSGSLQHENIYHQTQSPPESQVSCFVTRERLDFRANAKSH